MTAEDDGDALKHAITPVWERFQAKAEAADYDRLTALLFDAIPGFCDVFLPKERSAYFCGGFSNGTLENAILLLRNHTGSGDLEIERRAAARHFRAAAKAAKAGAEALGRLNRFHQNIARMLDSSWDHDLGSVSVMDLAAELERRARHTEPLLGGNQPQLTRRKGQQTHREFDTVITMMSLIWERAMGERAAVNSWGASDTGPFLDWTEAVLTTVRPASVRWPRDCRARGRRIKKILIRIPD